MKTKEFIGAARSRRSVLKLIGGGMGAGLMSGVAAVGPVWAQAAPIKLGFQLHATGIGASYGRWYQRTADAALKLINDGGGINGRPVEIIYEDDATDPARGAEVVDKFVNQHGCDMVMGTLFSHVVIGSAPRAGELKVPYLVCSEGYHVASGMLNRWTLQPGITDVRNNAVSHSRLQKIFLRQRFKFVVNFDGMQLSAFGQSFGQTKCRVSGKSANFQNIFGPDHATDHT